MDKVNDEIFSIFLELNPYCDEMHRDSDLFENGFLDSLKLMTLVGELESFYDICIDPEDLIPDNFQYLSNIECLVKKKVESGRGL